jgi:hypothetical protein
VLQEQVPARRDGDQLRARDAGSGLRRMLIGGERVVGGVNEQRWDADVLEREGVRHRFGDEPVERDALQLAADWEQRLAYRQEERIIAGVPAGGNAHDPGEQLRPVLLEQPPAALPADDPAAGGGDRARQRLGHSGQVRRRQDQPVQPAGVA